ncbi:MAG: GWxTD domain-containing protein [bacterium]|nr:GWxTD domain-containing protein [bacterium]
MASKSYSANVKNILLSILLILLATVSFAATRMRVDSVRFYDSDGNTRFEFPISVARSKLHYRTDQNDVRFTSYRFQMQIIKNDSVVASEIWDRIHRPGKEGSTSSGFIPDLGIASLPAGIYRAVIELSDSAGHFRERANIDSLRAQPLTKQFTLSSLLVCSDIREDSGSSDEFHRNGFRVIPYAERTFSPQQPLLYLYWEQYNQLPDTLLHYTVQITNSDGNVVKSLPDRTKQFSSDRGVNMESVPLRSLSAGTYTVSVIATLVPSGRSTKAHTRIHYVFDRGTGTQVMVGDTLTPQVLVPVRDLHYIVDEKVLETVKLLPDIEQLQWLTDFWAERDPTPGTAVNEKMEDYRKQLASTTKFSSGEKEGWQTDRGRILLTFGPPDDINDSSFESTLFSEEAYHDSGTNRPFVIWRYNTLAGGVVFVFGDLRLWGDYQLMHSTMPGEKTDPNWRLRLRGIK